MEIHSIAFFNHFHNGDIFLSKPYVKYVMDTLPQYNYYYLHKNNNKIIADLKINQIDLNSLQINEKTKFFVENNTLYINTHIGCYFPEIDDAECNWITTHKVYEIIYKTISNILNTDLFIKNIDDYVYETNYKIYDVPLNLDLDYENTIIISNGPVMSGQSNIHSFDNVVHYLVHKYPNKKFILTHRTEINTSNILYTSDLIKTTGSDLNEISYIADQYCKYIIGRQSGPFIFMNTNSILNNPNKKIFSLRYNRNCDFLHEIKVKSQYFSILDHDINYVFDTIEKNIGE